ncbi:MAG: hypothetical protein AAGI23_08025 [Bacteroidota bacterium]
MNEQQTPPEAPPPILGSWERLYWAVLIIHAVIIISFYLFTQYYQ